MSIENDSAVASDVTCKSRRDFLRGSALAGAAGLAAAMGGLPGGLPARAAESSGRTLQVWACGGLAEAMMSAHEEYERLRGVTFLPARMHRHREETSMNARHPCFNVSAAGQCERIHLPVAPDCNISCAYCNRKTDCPNESRLGVCSRVLGPEEAAALVDKAARHSPSLAVVGIASPGDPLANPELTLRVLELVRRRHPRLLLCLSTNGLVLADYATALKSLGVGHITMTMNAVTPAVACRIYHGVRVNACSYYGQKAAEILLDKQERALATLAWHGLAVKVNTVVMPGINDEHVEEIARFAARFKVELMNCIGLIPLPGTAMSALAAPSAKRMAELRQRAGKYVLQMRHCARCRADAFGLLSRHSPIEAVFEEGLRSPHCSLPSHSLDAFQEKEKLSC